MLNYLHGINADLRRLFSDKSRKLGHGHLPLLAFAQWFYELAYDLPEAYGTGTAKQTDRLHTLGGSFGRTVEFVAAIRVRLFRTPRFERAGSPSMSKSTIARRPTVLKRASRTAALHFVWRMFKNKSGVSYHKSARICL